MQKKVSMGQKAADSIVNVIGSWKFIIIQSIFLLIWLVINAIAWKFQWDPYPFIFLNLALSFQAAYTAPIILMSQNRMSDEDRKKASLDLYTDKRAEQGIEEVQKQLMHVTAMIGELMRNKKNYK